MSEIKEFEKAFYSRRDVSELQRVVHILAQALRFNEHRRSRGIEVLDARQIHHYVFQGLGRNYLSQFPSQLFRVGHGYSSRKPHLDAIKDGVFHLQRVVAAFALLK
jgi:hypothetical protein